MMAAGERPDAGAALVRALLADAEAAGCDVRIVSATARDWASATFVGAQHWITMAVTGSGLDAWLAGLPEADLPIRRHVLGDLVIDGVETIGNERQVMIAALTLIDG